MTLGRLAIAAAAVAFAKLDAFAMDIPVEIDGKTVVISATPLNRPIQASDREAGSQQSALGCSFLHFAHLARGDIAAASALSTDPQGSTEKLTQYRDRIGADEFRNAMAAYFTSGNVVLAEFALGELVMLAVKGPEYTAGQFFARRDGQWRWVERPPAEAARALGRVLQRIQSGELKL